MGRGSAPGFSRWVSDAGALLSFGLFVWPAFPSAHSVPLLSTPVSCMQLSVILSFFGVSYQLYLPSTYLCAPPPRSLTLTPP